MILRSLAILILLFPMLSSVGSLGLQGQEGDSDSKCCQVVKVISCCGEVSYETKCQSTMDDCQCAVRPNDHPLPASIPLLPLTLGSLVFELAPSTELTFEAGVETPVTLHDGMNGTPLGVQSHNQAQAILGIWRI